MKETWHIWTLAGMGFWAFKALTPGLYFLAALGTGCLITAALSLTGVSIDVQMIIFVVGSCVLIFLTRPFLMWRLQKKGPKAEEQAEARSDEADAGAK